MTRLGWRKQGDRSLRLLYWVSARRASRTEANGRAARIPCNANHYILVSRQELTASGSGSSVGAVVCRATDLFGGPAARRINRDIIVSFAITHPLTRENLTAVILHIDMDAFYASVEIRDDPSLQGKPVVVGGSPRGRGVVSAASYAAREFGIHSAMPAARAVRLCPQAVFIKPRMRYYAEISRQIREIFGRFTSLVEPLALDEAFLDVSGSRELFGEPRHIAQQIKQTIRTEIGITASAGVAPNKFLAKVASDLKKPDGLVYVDPQRVAEFLDPLPIARVWGVGPQTEKKFRSLGVATVGQIRRLPPETLQHAFGVNSEHFWRLSRGIDSRPVVCDHEAKSVSHETTFAFDIADREHLRAWLLELTEQVGLRMRRYDIKGKTINLKIRFHDFRTIVRSHSLSVPTHTTGVLWETAATVLDQALGDAHPPVRLLGMGVSNLIHQRPVQRSLFDRQELEKLERLDETCDRIRDKLGSAVIRPATSMAHEIRLRPDPRVDE